MSQSKKGGSVSKRKEYSAPALEKGLAKAGRSRDQLQILCATVVITGDDEQQLEASKLAVKKQFAFYGSTPAYLPTLECHGWGEVHKDLNKLSKQGRWDEMTDLISDEILETIAVVRPPGEVAPALMARLDGIADGVSLTHNRAPDPTQWADVVADLKAERA